MKAFVVDAFKTGAISVDEPAERPLRDTGTVLDGIKDRKLSGKFVLRVA